MNNILNKLLASLMLVVALITSSSLAVCNQTSASTADKDLWKNHGCWQAFYLWQYKAYNMTKAEWGNRGWNDACNVNLEYPKHWNAAYLLTYGLQDNLAKSFHGTADYRATAEAAASKYHAGISHVATDDTSIFGSFTPSSGKVATSCLLYNATSANANPASRAGDFMHEGWHAWLKKYKYNNGSYGGHHAAVKGSGCTTSDFCDYFYFHGIGEYAFGAMWENDGTAKRFHSPNQVQVEFLCDVAEFPKAWVPMSVRQSARDDANTRATERFINGPGFACGDPRPW